MRRPAAEMAGPLRRSAAPGTRWSRSGGGGADRHRRHRDALRSTPALGPGRSATAQRYAEVSLAAVDRISTGLSELDRVLGGGVVPGSLVLLGGEPGIGKSTLLLRLRRTSRAPSGPSSTPRARRASRRSRPAASGSASATIRCTCSRDVPRAGPRRGVRLKPALLIVDSIQTVFSTKLHSAPGSVGQVREAATQLLFAAKGQNVPTFIIGHVTKDGALAGPKVLEHVVDTVLYFEGERHHAHRVVRAVKNRFGAASEVGVFEMTGAGLQPVPNPSALFLAERPDRVAGLRCCARSKAPASAARRSAGARQHQHLWLREADRQRPRRQPGVAAPGGAREARRAGDVGRRRVRQRRRRPVGRRAGRRSRRRGGAGLQPAQPAGAWIDGAVRRGRPGRRSAARDPRRAARARGRPPRLHPRHPAAGQRPDGGRSGRRDAGARRQRGELLDALFE